MEYLYHYIDKFLFLIPLTPLLGFIINGLWGSRYPRGRIHLIANSTILISLFFAIIALVKVIANPGLVLRQKLFDWINLGNTSVPFGFQVDALTAVMITIVTLVSSFIHLYSIGYMADDETPERFFAYLNLFVAAMLILVMADNLILMFLGWEGVGLCSYLLIGYWFTDMNNSKAADKAFIVNRIGDLGFVIAIAIAYGLFGTVTFSELQAKFAGLPVKEAFLWSTVIALLMFWAATGKSAQIPLYVWLPDAMAGPTPVSALIHAATMVTAGVYMIARLHFIYAQSEVARFVVLIIGAITALYAGTIAITQRDIKKVLAYSTISQLGFMFMAMGAGAYAVGIFHLVTHAFFKALLFMGAGSVIIALHHTQDMFKMGGLSSRLPITYVTFVIAAMALSAVLPYISGFVSKDRILEVTLFSKFFGTSTWGVIFWIIGVLAAIFTSIYIWRAVSLTFTAKTNIEPEKYAKIHEPSKYMSYSMIGLAFFTLFAGIVGLPSYLGGGDWFNNFLNKSIFKHIHEVNHSPALIYLAMIITWGLATITAIWVYKLYTKGSTLPVKLATNPLTGGMYKCLLHKYYVDEIYDATVVKPTYLLSKGLYKIVDDVLIDKLLVNGTRYFSYLTSLAFRKIQSPESKDITAPALDLSEINKYALLMLLGLIVILVLVLV